MNFRLIIPIVLTTILCSCFQGEQGPQGIQGVAGPKGDDGKNYVEHDSTFINSENSLKITATKEWLKSGVNVTFGDKILIKATTNIPQSSSIGGLSSLLLNEQINALYMKVGNSEYVKVGLSYAGLAQDSGELEFAINTTESDSSQFYSIDSLVVKYQGR